MKPRHAPALLPTWPAEAVNSITIIRGFPMELDAVVFFMVLGFIAGYQHTERYYEQERQWEERRNKWY